MNKLKRSAGAKAAAILLLALCIPMALGSSLCAAVLAQYGVYSAGSLADTDLLSGIINFDLEDLGDGTLYYWETARGVFRREFSRERCNTIVTVADESGETVLYNYIGEPIQETTVGYTLSYASIDGAWRCEYSEGHDNPVTISYLREKNPGYSDLSFVEWLFEEKGINTFGMTHDEILEEYSRAYEAEYNTYRQTEEAFADYEGYYNITLAVDRASVELFSDESIIINGFGLRWVFVGVVIGGIVLGLGLFVFLCRAAGWRREGDRPVGTWVERIPLGIFLGISMAVVLLLALVTDDLADSFDMRMPELVGFAAGVYALVLTCVAVLHSLIARFKCREWWRYTVLYGLWRAAKWLMSNISAVWQVLVICGAWQLVNLILWLVVLERFELGVFLLGLCSMAAVAGVVVLALQWQRLADSAQAIASGNSDARMDTTRMLPAFRSHGEALNRIGEGVSAAVEEQLKSERMKTDLITNVSHDLKTPLTSIVSYVGLLKGETIENETARGYIDTLDRQAVRLGRLIEDLVEASKVTSGSITPSLAPVNVGELLEQAVSEYDARLSANNLEPVLTIHGDMLTATADGRLLWRVFDNLLSNACKYAMPGTRLYIDGMEQNGRIAVSFRNVSAKPLNIPAEELMERFVRGDSARTTSGSGLGLTIARSLAELQGGTFSLQIDGDLFKAYVTLPVGEAVPAEEYIEYSAEQTVHGDESAAVSQPIEPSWEDCGLSTKDKPDSDGAFSE